MKTYKWGVVGLGTIATEFAQTFNQKESQLYAAASRNLAKATQFAAAYGIEKAYGSYQELFSDPEVDIVYVATPHNHHLEIILAALTHGKHVLCEKAITMDSQELARAKKLATEKNLILAEAMTIFSMPLYQELQQRIAANLYGKLKMIQVSFGSFKEPDARNRFFNPELAGGALLDIGTYAFSFARFFLSTQPTFLETTVLPFPTGVDEQSVTILRNAQDEMATVALTFQAKMPKQGIVAFEKAFLTINDFPRADQAILTFTDGSSETIKAGTSDQALNYEIANMIQLIKGAKENTALALSTDVLALMDQIRTKSQEK